MCNMVEKKSYGWLNAVKYGGNSPVRRLGV